MEVKSTALSLYGDRDGQRGAGGKLGKAQVRKRLATPYDRHPVLATHGGTGSWWSKLGNPAYRLVSGATKIILPSFLTAPLASTSTSTSTEPEHKDNLDLEVVPNAKVDDPCNNYEAPGITEKTEPTEVASDRLKTTHESEGCGRDWPKNLNSDSQLSRIEQLIKGKTFSRDEINRLAEILNSRIGSLSDIDRENKSEVTTSLRHTVGVKSTPFQRISDEGNREDTSRAILGTPKPLLYSNAKDGFGASPVDIARAYMGSRLSEPGPGSHNALPGGEEAMQPNDKLVAKQFTPSFAQNSSTCWPGAMVQDLHGYRTPSQRGRYGLHDFPRTPYSRTIYSKSRSKLTHLQADSNHQTTSPKAFPRLQAPIFGQVNSRYDEPGDGYGSVGPIRRMRSKFASEARSRGGSTLLNPSKDASWPYQQPSVAKGFPSAPEKNLEPGETSKHWRGDQSGNMFEESVPLLNPSCSQTVKKILERLDRNKPTPKEKAAELKLATSWRKSPPEASYTLQKENISLLDSGKLGSLKNTNSIEHKVLSEGNKGNSNCQAELQNESIEAKDAVVTSSKTSEIVIGNSGTTNGVTVETFFSQRKSFQQGTSMGINNAAKERGPDLFVHKQSNGQHVTTITSDSHFELANKLIPHSSGTKPVLPHISVGRRDANCTFSLDNGTGFTFPISSSSSVLSEPPTPSVMPFSSSGAISHSRELPTFPSYSFGSENSASRLVFSFPSIGSAPNYVDTLDPKFNFGSDEKPRLSFGSVGKDAICY